MKKALKELIENAPTISSGRFTSFLIIPNGEYHGFWGKNGYDNIMVLVKPEGEKEYYKLSEEADVFNIFDLHIQPNTFNLDIPHEYGVPRIWFNTPIEIDFDMPNSTLLGYAKT